MGHEPQDGRVDRATSRLWRTPVASACLKTLAVTGLAGVAWLFAGSSAAHADTDLAALLGSGAVSETTGPVVIDPITAGPVVIPPAASAAGSAMSAVKVARPLAAMASSVPKNATAAVSSARRYAGGALAPATTSAAGAVDGIRAIARSATPALGSTDQVETLGLGQLPLPVLPIAAAATETLAVPQALNEPIDAGQIVAGAVRNLRPVAQPLPAVMRDVIRPIGDASPSTGNQPVDRLGSRIAPPLQWATPAQGAERLNSYESAAVTQAARTLDGASSPAAGATEAPTLPSPARGPIPATPGAGTNSGSSTSSFASHFDGSAGMVSAGTATARLLALRPLTAAVESGVPLIRAEELAATPD